VSRRDGFRSALCGGDAGCSEAHEGRSGSLAALVAEATGMLEQAAEAERARVAAGLGSCKYGITLSSPSSVGASVGVVFWWPEEEEERRLTRRCL
jgi:hypothetical protein